MKTGKDGIKLIQSFESCKLEAYVCPAGIVTIGWGTTVIDGELIKLGTKITQEQADYYFQKDLESFENSVNSLLKVKIPQPLFDAIISLVYNIGVANFKRSTLLKLVNAKKFAEAAEQFLSWNKARDSKGRLRPLNGLTRRRLEEKKLYTTGLVEAYVRKNIDN